jgi:hypothetical protein
MKHWIWFFAFLALTPPGLAQQYQVLPHSFAKNRE